jgi:hypothetical protein
MVSPNLSNHHMYFDSLFVGEVLPTSGFRDRAVFMGAAQLPSIILFHKFCNMDEQDDLSNMVIHWYSSCAPLADCHNNNIDNNNNGGVGTLK